MPCHAVYIYVPRIHDIWPLRLRGPNNVGELLNVKLISTDISVTVAQIKKFQKTRCIFFRILLLGGPSPPIQLVPNPFNWSPNTVFTDISVTVAQIKKFQKTKFTYFLILLLGGPSPPSQLVPIPFNWSPNTFFTDIYSKKALFGHFVLWTPPPMHRGNYKLSR